MNSQENRAVTVLKPFRDGSKDKTELALAELN
jgi:hypothetical protein